jgi:hypothetical protein
LRLVAMKSEVKITVEEREFHLWFFNRRCFVCFCLGFYLKV